MPAARGSVTAWGGASGLSPRDAAVVELVGRFRLLAAEQIKELLFFGQRSKTPLDRALKRLTDAGYLARLGRMVGGFGGGSGQYVYQLGRVGWRQLGKGGGYRSLRAIDHHALTIADCFVILKRLERGGELTVIRYYADPVSRRTIGDILLTPDAYAEIGVSATRQKYAFWLEIDRDTENADIIRGKCSRYWRAYQVWDGEVFPYIVFVVPDERRRRELDQVISGGPDEAQQLFRVKLLETFAEVVRQILKEMRPNVASPARPSTFNTAAPVIVYESQLISASAGSTPWNLSEEYQIKTSKGEHGNAEEILHQTPLYSGTNRHRQPLAL